MGITLSNYIAIKRLYRHLAELYAHIGAIEKKV